MGITQFSETKTYVYTEIVVANSKAEISSPLGVNAHFSALP
jgi:hypothetical protein